MPKDLKERERLVVTGLTVIFLILWLGFVFHRSPSFAGSLIGSLIGIVGSLLMLVPLAYVAIKRIKRLKKFVTAKFSMRTLLAWHIYSGILGPILVLIHTGHKFESILGSLLTLMTIVVVVSGFVGRYLMRQLSQGIKEKKSKRSELEAAYAAKTQTLSATAISSGRSVAGLSRFRFRLVSWFFDKDDILDPEFKATVEAVQISDALADVEYALKSHELIKTFFSRWLKFHIALSLFLYGLLALHVASGFYCGMRWLQ